MAVMFNFTSDMKNRLEAEKLSIQKKAQSALTQDQFEVCDKIITLAADTASAQTDDLIKMIGQLGAALGIQTSEKDALGTLCDATVSIEIKMLVPVSDTVVLSPDKLRKTQVDQSNSFCASRSSPLQPASTSCQVASKSSVYHGSATSRGWSV